MSISLQNKNILITGAARRIGRAMALAVAREGGTVLLHHGHSPAEAEATRQTIETSGGKAYVLQADLIDPGQATGLMAQARVYGPLFALVNNAAIFEPLSLQETSLEAWNRHLMINLTAPFLLSQSFAASLNPLDPGRIVNIVDWRALHPGADHLAYTISKAGLAALTRSLAITLSPQVIVNGLALGAILPPSSGEITNGILKDIPANRWADLNEVTEALLFLLSGPSYITGEIIHVDGGRHLI
jgi:NAD(P)-dependent dehydrogenase (short-subunit alcohol dehydrogenase family)